MSKARDYAKSAAFIFCLTFKPSEPHLTAYLVEEGLTVEQVNTEVRRAHGRDDFGGLLCAESVAELRHGGKHRSSF